MLQGVFRVSAHPPVISVWALCHICCTRLLSEEMHPSWCAHLCLSPPQYLWASPMGTVPAPASSSPLPKLLAPRSLLSQPPSPRFPVLLHASLLPSPVISHPSTRLLCFPDLLALSRLPAFFLSSSPFHIYPLDSLFPMSFFLSQSTYPVLNPSFSSGWQSYSQRGTGFYNRKCWTIRGVGGAHSTTYNLQHCLFF